MSKNENPEQSLLMKFFVTIMKNYAHKINYKKINYDYNIFKNT
jgi:hypothetical protein